jgi:hypothetical protein
MSLHKASMEAIYFSESSPMASVSTQQFRDSTPATLAQFARRTIGRIIKTISRLRDSKNQALHNENGSVQETHWSLDEAENTLLGISKKLTCNPASYSTIQESLTILGEIIGKMEDEGGRFKGLPADQRTQDVAEYFMNKIQTAREDYVIANIMMQQYQDPVKMDTELFGIRRVFSSVFKPGVALISRAELAWPHYFMGPQALDCPQRVQDHRNQSLTGESVVCQRCIVIFTKCTKMCQALTSSVIDTSNLAVQSLQGCGLPTISDSKTGVLTQPRTSCGAGALMELERACLCE